MSNLDPPSSTRTPSKLATELDDAFGEEGLADHKAVAVSGFLVGLSGKHAGKLFRLKPGESIVGRSSKALVTLNEKAISHQHARLTLNHRGCYLTDLDSTNGTYLNDERITAARELHAGDVMRFGNTTFGYLTDAEDDEQHTRALARVTHPMIGATSRVRGVEIVTAGAPPLVHLDSAGKHAHDERNGLDQALDLLGLALGFLKRYWKLILATALVFAGIGAATMKLLPPRATAEFEIFLRQDQTKSAAQYFASRNVEYFTSAEKNFLNVELVRETMRSLGKPVSNEEARGIAGNLDLERGGQSTFIGRFRHLDHRFAEQFLARHLKNYLEKEIGKSIKVLSSEVELLRSQFQENEARLKAHESTLRDFKQDHLEALPELASGQIGSRASLLAQRDALSASLVRSEKELELARKMLASEDVFVGEKVQRAQPYEEGLASIRRQIAAAQANGFAEGHPELVRLRNEEARLLALVDQTVATSTTDTDRRANPEHKRLSARVGELQVQVVATSTELKQVEGRLGQLSKIAGEMPAVEAEVSDKMRKVEGSEALHNRLYEQLKAKELELEFERASVAARYDVIQPPRAFPLNPTFSTVLRAGVGGFVGIFAGIFLSLGLWLKDYAQRRRPAASTDIVQVTPGD